MRSAVQLNIRPETVKTRLHRARRLLRERTRGSPRFSKDTFPFEGARCARIIDAVMARLSLRMITRVAVTRCTEDGRQEPRPAQVSAIHIDP